MRELNWAVLGAGAIANEMAHALKAAGRALYAVGGRSPEKTAAFGRAHGAQKVYADCREMFADPAVDVVYIATPHNTHAAFLEEALAGGKHVLCEKAIALNSRELERAARLAGEKGLVLAEAMTIWHMPLYKELRRMVGGGELGRVQMITLSFGSFKEYDMQSRFFAPELAGGALLDIGVYALSLARSFMESQPDRVLSQMRPAPTGVDEQAGILLMNGQGQMAALALSLHAKQPKRAVISCEKGYIEILDYPRADRALVVDAATGARQVLTAGEAARALQYEVEAMERAILTGGAAAMRLDLTTDVMALMTALRREWGLQYPGEAL
ncbi:Gfo/Idh/MocA family protein [Allofournierella sp.]|uniref:Gfo/Idh/MocA family protein n=1 Tax=Allofournierella sp. TaxID=1940256 RepID=UPI003AB2F312